METNSSTGNQPQNTDDDQNDLSSSSETITYPLDIEYIVNEREIEPVQSVPKLPPFVLNQFLLLPER